MRNSIMKRLETCEQKKMRVDMFAPTATPLVFPYHEPSINHDGSPFDTDRVLGIVLDGTEYPRVGGETVDELKARALATRNDWPFIVFSIWRVAEEK